MNQPNNCRVICLLVMKSLPLHLIDLVFLVKEILLKAIRRTLFIPKDTMILI